MRKKNQNVERGPFFQYTISNKFILLQYPCKVRLPQETFHRQQRSTASFFLKRYPFSNDIFCLLERCKVSISFSPIYMWLRIEEILFPTKIYMLEITFIMVERVPFEKKWSRRSLLSMKCFLREPDLTWILKKYEFVVNRILEGRTSFHILIFFHIKWYYCLNTDK
jgi:hypothetical protein